MCVFFGGVALWPSCLVRWDKEQNNKFSILYYGYKGISIRNPTEDGDIHSFFSLAKPPRCLGHSTLHIIDDYKNMIVLITWNTYVDNIFLDNIFVTIFQDYNHCMNQS